LRFHVGDGSGNMEAGQVPFGHGQVFTSQTVSLSGEDYACLRRRHMQG
jgi:hypothetical protein